MPPSLPAEQATKILNKWQVCLTLSTDHYHHLLTPCDSSCLSLQFGGTLYFVLFPSHLVTRRRRQRPSAKLLFAPSISFTVSGSGYLPPFSPLFHRPCRLIDLFFPSPAIPSLSHFPGHTSPQAAAKALYVVRSSLFVSLIACLLRYLPSCYRSVLVLHSSPVSSTTTVIPSLR